MSISLFLGALGLLLLGMWMMTEGLKLAGGQALRHLLATWTSTRARGLFTGILVTALVQSSGAVSVAAIGFVNTKLMTFSQSLWVIFGSNVGTTLTAWIITIFGLKLDIGDFTYLMIGVGALCQVFAPQERGKALGMAIAGFGLLFLGISQLQGAFTGVAQSDVFLDVLKEGRYQLLWGLLIGFVLTVLMQSSTASLVLVLAALGSAIIDLETAAASVIGANVGSTSTALLSSIGSTVNAKRLALAHLLFNVVTGTVALLLLPAFLAVVRWIADIGFLGSDPLILLTIFHTLFNVAGVMLMWPLTDRLSAFLQGLFRRADASQATKYLDRNVASVPDLAVGALNAQLHLMLREIAGRRLERDVRAEDFRPWLDGQFEALAEVAEYLENLSRATLSEKLAQQLAEGLAIKHYLHNACQALDGLSTQYHQVVREGSWFAYQLDPWFEEVSDFCNQLAGGDYPGASTLWSEKAETYRGVKNALLSGATQGRCNLDEVDVALQIASHSKRFVEQLIHTLNRFAVLDEDNHSQAVADNGETVAPPAT